MDYPIESIAPELSGLVVVDCVDWKKEIVVDFGNVR